MKHLIEFISSLEKNEIGFCSLKESIDTTSSTGRLIFHIFGALAEFEREIINECCQAGRQVARLLKMNVSRHNPYFPPFKFSLKRRRKKKLPYD